MVHFIFLILIGSISSIAHGSETSAICGEKSGQKYLLGETFHSHVKDAAQKGLLNPKSLFTYWAQASNISNNLWDSFDSCLTGNAESSKDACIADWSILSSNFYLFIVDLHHYKTCNLQNFEKNVQQLEQISPLIEKTYKESQTFFHNLTENIVRFYIERDRAKNHNRTSISDNERSSARNRTLSCESTVHNLRSQYFNDSLSRLKSGKWSSELEDKFEAEIENDLDCQKYADRTVISDSEMESFLRTHISSSCERAPLDTKNRIICQWPSIRAQILEYENGQKPSLVHMKWIPTVLKITENVNREDNLPGLYLTYLLNLERYVVSSYFMLISFIEGDLTGRSSDVASWLAHDIGSRIALDRFSQLRLECQFVRNIRSMGFSSIKIDACEKLNDSAMVLLSNNEIRTRVARERSSDYAVGDDIMDINDTLKQLMGRPTRNELNTFIIPSLFRSKREKRNTLPITSQNERNLRIIARFIENHYQIDHSSWLKKIAGLLGIENNNCKEISRFLFSLGSTDRGVSHFEEMGKCLASNCGHSRDLNLWTVLGFEFQYENKGLRNLVSVVPGREPTQSELSEFTNVVLGIGLRLLILENDSRVELETDRATRSGVINSIRDWLLDLKYEHGIDKTEDIMSAKSNWKGKDQMNDPELSGLLKFLVREEAE